MVKFIIFLPINIFKSLGRMHSNKIVKPEIFLFLNFSNNDLSIPYRLKTWKFSIYRMMKRTSPLGSSREV